MRRARREDGGLSLAGLLGDFRLLLVLFVSFRLCMLLVYPPLLIEGGERGATAGGDFLTYYQLGALSERGLLPFRDWWSEFPPIPSALNVTLYQLAGRASYSGFAALYALLMLACEVGTLALVRRIGSRLHGAATGMALAWIYALLLTPALMLWWTFEPLVALLLLLALAWLLEGRRDRSAVAAGIGALVKFTPAVTLAAALRFRPVRWSARYAAVTLGLFAGVYVLLLLQNSAMTLPSLSAQAGKASYQTVWALLDGNYRTGNFGPIEERLDPANAARSQGNPAVIPGPLRLLAAAAIGLAVFVRTRRFDDRGTVAFSALALLLFFLQAQGWSPQWLAQLVPLLLLCFPSRDGVMALIVLQFVVYAEYPFLWMRTGDTGGVITGALVLPYVMLVLARTAILAAFGVALYRRVRQEPVSL